MICNYCKKEAGNFLLSKVTVETGILFIRLKTKELFFCFPCSQKLIDLINVAAPTLNEQLEALR